MDRQLSDPHSNRQILVRPRHLDSGDRLHVGETHMTAAECKEYILTKLEHGDDLERAEYEFRHCTPAEMQEAYWPTGETRQEVLDSLRKERARYHIAVAWLQNQ